MERSNDYLITGIRKGDKRCASLLMSLIEDDTQQGEECLKELSTTSERCYVLGITGWPGVGKSTLIRHIAGRFLNNNKCVGIIAVDPTSPLSGGSLLGDRERMRGIDGHERLFIRSMATRGHLGGIGAATGAFIRIMQAMRKDVIIVETVGVGQDQVSVSCVADTIVMTVVPGMGDYLQALKAGIMEFGDIFVVNKADRKGVEEVVIDLRMIIGMNECRSDWTPPIVKTVAVNDDGTGELMCEIERHREHVTKRGPVSQKRLAAVKLELIEMLKTRFFHVINEQIHFEKRLEHFAQQVIEGTVDRYTVAENIFREIGIAK